MLHTFARPWEKVEMNGWMTCDLSSSTTLFQLYQDDGRMIMKGYEKRNPAMAEKSSPRAGLELGTVISVDQGPRL